MEPVVAMYTAEAEEELLGGSPNFVLDAIDNIDTKVGPSWWALPGWEGRAAGGGGGRGAPGSGEGVRGAGP